VIGTAKGDGLAPHLKLGAIIVDMSSSDPMETRKLGESLQAQGSTLLDAPVSGGLRKAVAGTLSILLGGDNTEALEKVFPILSAMGTVLRTGGLGSGHATKALNNYVSAAGLAAACEAVIVGREFGLDPDILVDAINASTGRNNSTENKLKQFVLNEEFATAGFALDLMAKDVALAASLADAMGKALPGLTAARSLWAEAKSELGAGTDHTEIYRHLVKKAESNAS
jgi:3-hydroxyisobutyrate dehydrogenase